jgi:hypothetical protein
MVANMQQKESAKALLNNSKPLQKKIKGGPRSPFFIDKSLLVLASSALAQHWFLLS